MHHWNRAVKAALVGVVGMSALAVLPASAAPAEEHCAIRVIGQRKSGEFVTTAPECRSSRAEAVAAVREGGASVQQKTSMMMSFVIGEHYDGANYTGDSMSVVGDDCLGGWLNLSSTWDNRISSTINGCYRIKHFDSSSLGGSSQTILGAGGNLSTLDNKTESIQYLS